MKFLLWGLLVVIVVMWLTRTKKVSSGTPATDRTPPPASGEAMEAMVQCAHCGVHIPASESVAAPSGAVYCSEEHRLQHAKS